VGAPIFGPTGGEIFAISVTSLPIHFEGGPLGTIASNVVSAAVVATTALGGRIPIDWGHETRDPAARA
jgi:hypothetical protein